MRALIYVRISRDKVGAGLGIDRQEADCREVAERLGWDVVGVRTDNDISAYSGKLRPGYRQLLADLEAGVADAVLAWHTDRLHRSPVELETYVEVCERRNVVTMTVKAGTIDLATPSGRMIARMLGSSARYEVEHMIERQKSARLQSARAGSWAGGRRPFGYAADGVTVVDAEAAEIRAAALALLSGTSLGSVTADLNTRRIRTSTGGQWKATELRKMLTRPRNAGLRQHRGEVMGAAVWPAILDEDTWRALCTRLNDPRRRTSPEYGRRWLGSGLYRCGVCEQTVTSGTSSTGSSGHIPGYRCRTRQHVTRDAVRVDQLVEGVVLERLSRPDAASLLTAPAVDTGPLHAEAVTLRARLDDLAAMWADGVVDARQLAEGTERLRARLADVERAIGDAASVSALAGLVMPGGDIRERWATLDLARRRSIIDALMTVTINRGRRGRLPGGEYFDKTAIDIKWRA